MSSHNRNSVVAWRRSRGGRWLEEIVREHSVYLDVAVITAGHPESKGEYGSISAVRKLMAVKSTIVFMVHVDAHDFCKQTHILIGMGSLQWACQNRSAARAS